MATEKIAVLGGGSWGATLADHLARTGSDVAIWEFNAAVADSLQKTRSLKTLPQLKLHKSAFVSNNMGEALTGRDMILIVTPSHTVRSSLQAAVKSGKLSDKSLFINASKGIERDTLAVMTQVIRETVPSAGDIVAFSGPSHAEEVAVGQPVAMVAASENTAAAQRVQKIFASETFRVYTGDDPLGVELGGALKNIYAVACGIIDGLKLGDNTKAALLTRGLLEMTRLGKTMGAKTFTFFGLSGLGDLIVTCGSKHSRNRLVGEKVGSGNTLKQALAEMTMVAEGVNTTESAYQLAKRKNVTMPIVDEMHKVLFEDKPPRDSIRDLLARQTGAEMEGLNL
jgi:glycerol-3-phosphate dehydrogenase (NAD(P)+)